MEHICHVCENPVDLENSTTREEVLVLFYYDTLTTENSYVIYCSDKCHQESENSVILNTIIPGCIKCKTICTSYKWNLHAKFVLAGGWESTKFLCSEKCRKEECKDIKKAGRFNILCSFCKKATKNMKKCSKCEIAHYCNIDCQKSDWSSHKLKCKKNHKK